MKKLIILFRKNSTYVISTFDNEVQYKKFRTEHPEIKRKSFIKKIVKF